jgi:hypothetical protein
MKTLSAQRSVPLRFVFYGQVHVLGDKTTGTSPGMNRVSPLFIGIAGGRGVPLLRSGSPQPPAKPRSMELTCGRSSKSFNL